MKRGLKEQLEFEIKTWGIAPCLILTVVLGGMAIVGLVELARILKGGGF